MRTDARSRGGWFGYRTALVTGASAGLGAVFARELARRGCDLILVARRPEPIAATAAVLRADFAVRVEELPADLTDPGGLDAVAARLADPRRPVDLLVNNAGVFGGIQPLGARDPADLDYQVRLNVAAVVALTRAALPGMVRRKHGGVLNLSSVAGFLHPPGGAAYGAGKAFVISFSRTVHSEVRDVGVHVTVLCPGSVRTPATQGNRTRLGPVLEPQRVVGEGLDAVAAGRPVHIPGREYRYRVGLARYVPEAVLNRVFQRGWGRRNAESFARRLNGADRPGADRPGAAAGAGPHTEAGPETTTGPETTAGPEAAARADAGVGPNADQKGVRA